MTSVNAVLTNAAAAVWRGWLAAGPIVAALLIAGLISWAVLQLNALQTIHEEQLQLEAQILTQLEAIHQQHITMLAQNEDVRRALVGELVPGVQQQQAQQEKLDPLVKLMLAWRRDDRALLKRLDDLEQALRQHMKER